MENLNVIYEDNHIVVVVKPQNIPSQADQSGDIDMLSLVKAYIKEKYNKPGEAYIGLVHRLDRPTGGIMVFARTSKSANRLSEQIKKGEFVKTYYCVTEGIPKELDGHVVSYLKKVDNIVKIVPMSETSAKRAETIYKVLETTNNTALIKVNILTGRSHQIRVQMANLNAPIYGDGKYGKVNKLTNHLALWAGELSFKHPTKDETLFFKVYPPEEKPWTEFNLAKYLG